MNKHIDNPSRAKAGLDSALDELLGAEFFDSVVLTDILKKFPDRHAYSMERLLDAPHAHIIFAYRPMPEFNNLTRRTAEKLVEKGFHWYVAANKNKFKKNERHDIEKMLQAKTGEGFLTRRSLEIKEEDD